MSRTRSLWLWRLFLVLALISAGLLVADIEDGAGRFRIGARVLQVLCYGSLAAGDRVGAHRAPRTVRGRSPVVTESRRAELVFRLWWLYVCSG